MEQKVTPVLLGADLNCYNVARAFHEAYGVVSHAFGRYAVSATKYSKIVDFTAISDIDSEDVALRVLTEFAGKHQGEKLVLFGCTDDYATMIARLREKLPDYIIPYPDPSLQPLMACKAEFYELCEKHGIPYPSTRILSGPASTSDLTADRIGFDYPIIVKPSSSIEYWKHPFDGMKKVYRASTPDDAEKIISEIYASGYSDKMILQEFIEGGDAHMRVLTCFSDAKGRVRAMCIGHTMLEEHTPKGLGNHAAIVTEPVSRYPVAQKIKALLEEMKYTGFSNFDIKLNGSAEGGDFRVFEINLRQGRSNYYVTSSGINVARLAAELFLDESDDPETEMQENEFFWHHVPCSVAYKYTEDKALVEKAKKLDREGRSASSLWYKYDLRFNPLRFICVVEQLRRQKNKYKKYHSIAD